MNAIKLAIIASIVATSAMADTCHEREPMIQSIRSFLETTYTAEMARKAQIYAVAGQTQVRVRSYPGNLVCVGEVCIDSDTCEVQDCVIESMTTQGIQRSQGFSCWAKETEEHED